MKPVINYMYQQLLKLILLMVLPFAFSDASAQINPTDTLPGDVRVSG